jgi:hypothetical protein
MAERHGDRGAELMRGVQQEQLLYQGQAGGPVAGALCMAVRRSRTRWAR